MKLYLLLFPLILAGCGSGEDQKKTENVTLESYKVLSRDFMDTQLFCPATKASADALPQAYCQSIEGFVYQWGYTVKLSMYKEKVNNPPQDASNERLIVESKTIKKEDPVGTIYELKGVELEGLAFYQESGTYYLKGEAVSCAESANCNLLATMNDSGAVVDITLTYQGQGKIQLSAWQ
jgi:hypothetical protein